MNSTQSPPLGFRAVCTSSMSLAIAVPTGDGQDYEQDKRSAKSSVTLRSNMSENTKKAILVARALKQRREQQRVAELRATAARAEQAVAIANLAAAENMLAIGELQDQLEDAEAEASKESLCYGD